MEGGREWRRGMGEGRKEKEIRREQREKKRRGGGGIEEGGWKQERLSEGGVGERRQERKR